MAAFWVVGGEYADLTFTTLVKDATLERHGPFATYHDAYEVWQARARATIDDAMIRFRIVEDSI